MQGLVSWNQFLKISNSLKTCSTRFPAVQSASVQPELPQGIEVNTCSTIGFILPEADDKRPSCSVAGNALGKCQFVVDNTHLCLVEILGFGSRGFRRSSPSLSISGTLHAHITDIVSSYFCIFKNVYKNHITANLCSTVLLLLLFFFLCQVLKYSSVQMIQTSRKLKNSEPELHFILYFCICLF